MSDTRKNTALIILTAIVLVVVLVYPATSTLVEYQIVDGTLVFEGNYLLTNPYLISGSDDDCSEPHIYDNIVSWVHDSHTLYYYDMTNNTLVNVSYSGSSHAMRVYGVGEGFIFYDYRTLPATYGYPYLYFIENSTSVQISDDLMVNIGSLSGSRVAWVNHSAISTIEREICVFNTEDWSTLIINDDPTFEGVRYEVEATMLLDGTLIAYTIGNYTTHELIHVTHDIVLGTVDFEMAMGIPSITIFGFEDERLGLTDTVGNIKIWDTWDDEYVYEIYLNETNVVQKRATCLEDDLFCIYTIYTVGLNRTLTLASQTYGGNPELCNASSTSVSCSKNGIEKFSNGTYLISYIYQWEVYTRFLIPIGEDDAQELIRPSTRTVNETILGTTPATEEGGELSLLLVGVVVVSAIGVVYYIVKKKKGGTDYYEK